MSAAMKERDRQADERLKLMSDMMQRRHADANTRMVDLITTMHDLTLGVKAIVSQTAAVKAQVAPAPPAFNLANIPSTSAASLLMQTTYREIAQPSVGPTKPPKVKLPATYKRDPAKASKMVKVMHAESRDAATDPMTDVSSFDPFARGPSTRGNDYSAASGMTTQESNYQTAHTSAITNPPRQTLRDFVPRPVATSTQRKITTKRN